MRQLRVLHLVDNLDFGGMERVIAELIRRGSRDHFDTHVLVLDFLGRFAEGLDAFAGLHVARPMTRLSMVRPQSLSRDIAAIKPDIAHIHSGVWLKSARAASIAQVPIRVYTDHGRQHPDPWSHRLLDRHASRLTHAVVAVSEVLRDHLATFVVRPERISVIPNGVDTDQYVQRPDDGRLRHTLGIAPDAPVIGSTGRLQPVKGYDVMLLAFAELLKRWTGGPRPVLVVVGDGSERQRLEALANQLGVADLVRLEGWHSQVNRYLSMFDFFTMSSHSEGTSVSLLEAMSSGLCPVVTDVGGNARALGPELSHRLVPAKNPSALASAWYDALGDRARRTRDGDAARRQVVGHFSLDAMVREYEQLYIRLLQ